MRKNPTTLSELLANLTRQLPLLLGRNLVGIYLYGSVTNSAFNPNTSDVDCIVVTKRDVTDAQFRKLDRWLTETAQSNSWMPRSQIIFLIRDEVLTMNSKACLYQFGVLKRTGSDGNPIIWLDYLRSGKVLFGPPPESFLPKITEEILLEALKRELGYLRQEIIETPNSEWRDVPMYRAYAVLTVCRILYSFNKGEIVSKSTAAKWAIRNLPGRWREIIEQALDYNQTGRESGIPLKGLQQFVRFGISRVR
ncbi:MAG TPA: aminoglycoside adenylyltransferase domain-containing protein [Pyrinomonadaceae bacterium]